MSDFPTYVVEGDDAICIGRFDFDAVSSHGNVVDIHAGGSVETALAHCVDDSGDTAVGGANHVPADVHIFADEVTVVIGESPDATSGGEQAIPFIGGELTAVETTDGRVENFHPEIVLPLSEILEAAVIEVLHPVGVIDDGETSDFVDVVDDFLAVLDRLDESFCTDVQQMRAIARDLVAGKENQAAIVDLGVILTFGNDVMIADHEKIVTGIGVFIDDVLDG